MFKIVRRKNRDGRECVAPFIEGYNVWDIPVKEWTPAVAAAIRHAHGLGWEQCKREIARSVNPKRRLV